MLHVTGRAGRVALIRAEFIQQNKHEKQINSLKIRISRAPEQRSSQRNIIKSLYKQHKNICIIFMLIIPFVDFFPCALRARIAEGLRRARSRLTHGANQSELSFNASGVLLKLTALPGQKLYCPGTSGESARDAGVGGINENFMSSAQDR
ncbi:hypothetical protein EVAR_63079_1 [Eumeta japonica]|uniref:Uncharacterized protein n=1 Tax=Eumeta variegata TaxID=151549 RepID=A0A4C1ZZR6_EUMVA|nr:hypothetical protein EVAR_63079_1 [Eumeta japonica]